MKIDDLERRVNRLRGKHTADIFFLDNGELFEVDDAFAWLIMNGVETPRGRIVAFRHPERDADPLTQSIIETIDAAIEAGGMPEVF